MIENFHHAKLEELSIYDASTDSDLLQLSPGPLDFRATKVELPEVRLQWNRLGASLRTREFCDVRAFSSASLCTVLARRGSWVKP